MSSKNICKFVTPDINSQLMPIRFILESEPAVMKQRTSNSANRMVLITRRAGHFHLGADDHPCTAGDVLLFFENETYFFEGETDFQYMYIDFKGLRAGDLFRRFGIHSSNRQFSGFDGLIPLWSESLSRATEENIDLAAESVLLYTFSKFRTSAAKTNDCVNRAIEITEQEFDDPTLSIAAVAERLGYNAKYLSHIFKKKTGVGYAEYLQTFRIKYAVSLFEHGLDSIKNVALLSGFTDPLYFSTVFKNKLGTSPKAYVTRLCEEKNPPA